MPVLVDTSAWIEFFHPRGVRRVKQTVAMALADGVVIAVAPVLIEVLAGLDPGHAADARAIERLRALQAVEVAWDVCLHAGELGRMLNRRGQRVPTVDLMIAAAAASGEHEVWHAGDKHFAAIERAGGPRQRDLTLRYGSSPRVM